MLEKYCYFQVSKFYQKLENLHVRKNAANIALETGYMYFFGIDEKEIFMLCNLLIQCILYF